MKRRDILAGLGSLATGTASSFRAPAIAQGLRTQDGDRLARRVAGTSVQRGSLGTDDRSRNRRAHQYRGISIRRIGAPVRDLRRGRGWRRRHVSFDRVLLGKKGAGVPFFAAVPFGFTADELFAWVHYGGGQELWDSLSGQFNIKPLLCLNSGTQMGGWFTREVSSPEEFKGLRYRMPGLGAEVLRRLGAIVVTLPGSEIVPALKSGAIDASEWVGPWLDIALGLHKAAGYYYFPGFHEPGTGSAVGINKTVWESMDPSDQKIIAAVAASEYARSLAEFSANNALSVRKLRDEGSVKILKFDNSVLKSFAHNQQGSRRRGRLRGRSLQENLCKLPAVPRVDHGLERHRRTRLPQRARACVMEQCDHEAARHPGQGGIVGYCRRLKLCGARNRAGPTPTQDGHRLARHDTGYPPHGRSFRADNRHRNRWADPNRGVPAGALVRPFETFDAVGAGVADMYHTDEGYLKRSRRRSISSRRCRLASRRTSCSRGSGTEAAKSCGTRSALNLISSHFSAPIQGAKRAGGLPTRSAQRKVSGAWVPDARAWS